MNSIVRTNPLIVKHFPAIVSTAFSNAVRMKNASKTPTEILSYLTSFASQKVVDMPLKSTFFAVSEINPEFVDDNGFNFSIRELAIVSSINEIIHATFKFICVSEPEEVSYFVSSYFVNANLVPFIKPKLIGSSDNSKITPKSEAEMLAEIDNSSDGCAGGACKI